MSKQSFAKSVAAPVASAGPLTPTSLHTIGTAADELSALLHAAGGCRTGGRESDAWTFIKAARERLGAICAVLPPIAPASSVATPKPKERFRAPKSSPVASEIGSGE